MRLLTAAEIEAMPTAEFDELIEAASAGFVQRLSADLYNDESRPSARVDGSRRISREHKQPPRSKDSSPPNGRSV